MPSKPLLDFETTDLSKVVTTHDELYKVLRQAGTFALLDGILHMDPNGELVVGYKDIRDDDWWVPDHIPGRPLFPGALMIEACAQVCSYDYLMRVDDLDGRFLGFGGLGETRFRGQVEPGVRMIFAGKVTRVRKSMFLYDAQGFVDGKLVFETVVRGVVF
jgi:3-hydroxyacyl-[acyl-carrier-protein] dehydratase